jgi:hypothetical protein
MRCRYDRAEGVRELHFPAGDGVTVTADLYMTQQE